MSYDFSRVRLDVRANTPLFEQIAARLREDIQRGELAIDDQLPTVRQLAQELKINFNTVARAYRILDAEGLILSRQGQGSFVTANIERSSTVDEAAEESKDSLDNLRKLLLEIETVIQASGCQREEVLAHLCAQNKSIGQTRRVRIFKRTAYTRFISAENYLSVLQESPHPKRRFVRRTRQSEKGLT